MRFKARMVPEQVQLLYNIITPIARLNGSGSLHHPGLSTSTLMSPTGGRSVIHIDPDHVRISTRGGSASNNTSFQGSTSSSAAATSTVANDAEGISCFIELITENGIFLEHKIESVANNVIVFEIDLTQLKIALQSILSSEKQQGPTGRNLSSNVQPLFNSHAAVAALENGEEEDEDMFRSNQRSNMTTHVLPNVTPSIIVMKLAKRNGGIPCLCLDAMGGAGRGAMEVHHAIPIRIMRAIEMQYHLPPKINMPHVQLELPSDRPLRPIVERLRLSCPQLYIEGSMAGELVLRIESEGVSIRTYLNKLIPRFEDCQAQEDDAAAPAKCILKVDTRKFLACLQWQSSLLIGRAISSAVLCMVENEMLVLHVTLFPESVGFFTFYVPVHFLSDLD